MVSSAIWKKHARVSFLKTIKIARVQFDGFNSKNECNLMASKNSRVTMVLKNLHEKPCNYLLIIYMKTFPLDESCIVTFAT